jgi:hypothetical protein
VAQLASAVVYDGLPISSGGAHAINRLRPNEALASWRAFLTSCTAPTAIEAFFRVDNDGPWPKADRGVVRLIKDAFPEEQSAVIQSFKVPEGRLDDAVRLFEDASPLPSDAWDNTAVGLNMYARFHMLRPDGSGLWPGQDPALFGQFQTPSGADLGTSSARLNMAGGLSMGLMLTFPEATDDDIAVLRPWLQSHLPFRMSARQWVRWSISKSGQTYRPKRLAPPDGSPTRVRSSHALDP